ncbi:Neurotransmitter-gated ion-channel ligand binding domain [Popillia japonica]|uniref:Neurotransmitter-gated ion-channel ligand binding domain n=1 Tax=Popillia japonica TaxID=7064 RepID=A0AAW1L5D2_POPJA
MRNKRLMLSYLGFSFILFQTEGGYLRPFQTEGGFTTKIGPRPLWNATYTDKLRQDLLLNYDKFARSSPHQNTTKVLFSIVLRHVEVNEFKSALTVYAISKLVWHDEKLKWNASDYGGIENLNMAEHEIWQPDLFLLNSGVSTAISHYNSYCRVSNNGEIIWVPPTQFTVLCDLNLKYWPFDTQQCYLQFISWTHHGNEIDLQIYNNETSPEIDEIIKSTEWIIGETSIKHETKIYDCCKEPYPSITITVNLIRRSPSYKALIITPAFVIIGLILSSFWLPPQAGEKIILNGCTAIIITIFLLYFTQKIPAMGSHTPLVVFFYSSCLWIICFSIVGSVVVILLSRSQHNKPLPWVIKQPLTGCIGKWLGISSYAKNSTHLNITVEEMRDHQVTDFDENGLGDDKQFIAARSKTQYQNDWILLACVLVGNCSKHLLYKNTPSKFSFEFSFACYNNTYYDKIIEPIY